MKVEEIKVGKRTYKIIRSEDVAGKYPNIAKRGWLTIHAAMFGETLYQIYVNENGVKKAIRAFV